MVEIGYQFDLRDSMPVSWDDRFQQLVEYGQVNGNFDVPTPGSDEMDDGGVVGDKLRFYKWVNRLHNEYRGRLGNYVICFFHMPIRNTCLMQ